MKIITINITDDMIKLFKVVIDLGYAPSRSEAIRRVLDFGLPYFLGLNEIYHQIGQKTFPVSQFKKPEQFESPTIEELRKEYPYLNDYKYINEELVLE